MVTLILQAFYTTTLFYFAVLTISEYRIPKTQLISAIVCSGIFSAILCANPKYVGFANAALVCFAIFLLFRATKAILTSISFSILGMVILIISTQVATYISDNILQLAFHSVYIDISPYVDILGVCALYVLATTTTLLLSKLVGMITQKAKGIIPFQMSTKYTMFLLFGFLLILFYLYFHLFIVLNIETQFLNAAISSIVGILLLIFLLGTVYIFLTGVKKTLESAHNQELISQLQNYTISLENMNGEMRKFRHDYMNMIASLYGYLEAKDLPGLDKYFTTNIAPVAKRMSRTNRTLDRLKNICVLELKGILALKLMHAQEQGIQVLVEVADKIDSVNFDIVNLTRVIGILLDNAEEACLEVETPTLKLCIVQEAKVMTILIINTFQPPLPPIEEMRREGFSTKGEHRGLGLYTANQIIDQSGTAVFNTYVRGNEFVQELIFSKK